MKTFVVTLFQLGIGYNVNTNEFTYVEADSQEEAEQIAHDDWFDKGYGVWDSQEYRENLTEEQEKQARNYMNKFLSGLIPDNYDRDAIISAIEEDVYMDIEECAGWLKLGEDEWCPRDVEIAVARVLKQRICG